MAVQKKIAHQALDICTGRGFCEVILGQWILYSSVTDIELVTDGIMSCGDWWWQRTEFCFFCDNGHKLCCFANSVVIKTITRSNRCRCSWKENSMLGYRFPKRQPNDYRGDVEVYFILARSCCVSGRGAVSGQTCWEQLAGLVDVVTSCSRSL